MINERELKRRKRHTRSRKNMSGTAERPRLVIFRSSKHLYASFVVDDGPTARVIATVSSLAPDFRTAAQGKATGYNVAGAKVLGQLVADRAKQAGITTIIFDRAGYRYAGRMKALADAARKGGLQF